MKSDTIIAVGLDHNYFHFLQDFLYSFEACGATKRYNLGIIDAGLLPEQIEWLKRFGVARIVRPPWPFAELNGQPTWTKASYCRPFFPEYFPEWSFIVYFDADSWLQDFSAIDDAVAGADEDGLAVVPLLDRCHWPLQGQTHALVSMNWHKQCLQNYFGADVAARYQLHPLVMAGFFAARRDAPHWIAWRNFMAQGLKNKIHYDVDQASLTLVVHASGLPVHFLPHHRHWVCHLGHIGLDTRNGVYVEPYHPHQPISSLGLAAQSKREPVLVRTTDGRILNRLLRYGRQHEIYAINLGKEGGANAFDGIARNRFRNEVFTAVSREGGVRFLQIGAMDGIAFDPIHEAIVHYGWTGILVEPLPDMQERLRNNYADIPGLTFVTAAITETSGRQVMRRVSPSSAKTNTLPLWTQGLSSLRPERNPLSGKHVTQEQYDAFKDIVEDVEIDCLSFADFACEYSLDHFDVCQIDAEGYDWHILRQIDLTRYRPKCIHMELACLPTEEVAATINHLRLAGYACYAMEDGQDLLALQRDFGKRHFGLL